MPFTDNTQICIRGIWTVKQGSKMELNINTYQELLKKQSKGDLTVADVLETIGTSEQSDVVELIIYGYGQAILMVASEEAEDEVLDSMKSSSRIDLEMQRLKDNLRKEQIKDDEVIDDLISGKLQMP